jgi:hypothetical protein
METQLDNQLLESKRLVRLVLLLHAAANAGLTPIPLRELHSFSYLANVLSPIWGLEPFDKSLLKREGGPLYVPMQRDLNQLVGNGLASVHDIKYHKKNNGKWELEGKFNLNHKLSERILEMVDNFDDEKRLRVFLEELAYALSALGTKGVTSLINEDATYGDQVSIGEVIDFAEWKEENYSANAADNFRNFFPKDSTVTPGRKTHLYIHHLSRRANATG